MLTVIFELWPNAGRREDYLGLAADLRPELLRIDGFLGNERFESRREPGTMLALSSWRDMAAAGPWLAHPDLAGPGRQHRLMRVVRDYGLTRREEAPHRSAA